MAWVSGVLAQSWIGLSRQESRKTSETWLLLSISTLVITFGIYIMSAYLGRTYLEVKGRPCYIIAERIGLPSEPEG